MPREAALRWVSTSFSLRRTSCIFSSNFSVTVKVPAGADPGFAPEATGFLRRSAILPIPFVILKRPGTAEYFPQCTGFDRPRQTQNRPTRAVLRAHVSRVEQAL